MKATTLYILAAASLLAVVIAQPDQVAGSPTVAPKPAATSNASAPRGSDYDYEAPAPGSYTLPVVKPAADGLVLDVQHRERPLSDFTRGRVTLLSFIYTRCSDAKACPYATGVLSGLHDLSTRDAVLARHLRLVSMSFDPVGDSPQRMAAYSEWLRARPAGAPWDFLTTASQERLQPILAAYGQAVSEKRDVNSPTGPLNHTLRVYLIDRAGRIRNIYSSGTLDARLVLADVQTLLQEEEAETAAVTASAKSELPACCQAVRP